MEQDRAINKLKEYVKEKGFLLAYIFGSRALGKAGSLSDYDIAILCASRPDSKFIYQVAHELANILRTDKIDVINLSAAPLELQYKIIKDGILLHEENKYTRIEFEANVLSRYFDFLPVLRKQREDILKERKYERRIQRHREALGKTLRVLDEIRTSPAEVQRRI
ncbi:MAG TPA: nucleotidyltransferase domain-containing protein [Deltaproteobacteria bacterium]|nr:nucleotidyltransferase domain-containing protein [Deltaproteobacteria bacterium]